MREITKIVVHGTMTKPSFQFSVKELAAEHYRRGIRGSVKGSRTAYHHIITKDGVVHQGRSMEEPGRLCGGENENCIAILLEGGMDMSGRPSVHSYSDEQFDALHEIWMDTRYAFPDLEILGHRDVYETTEDRRIQRICPGFDVRTWARSVLWSEGRKAS